jgi:hypothetical protein
MILEVEGSSSAAGQDAATSDAPARNKATGLI